MSKIGVLAAGGVGERSWRADGEREGGGLGVGRRRRRDGRRVPVEQDEPGLQLFLLLPQLGQLRNVVLYWFVLLID
jgi:hypothetical protein